MKPNYVKKIAAICVASISIIFFASVVIADISNPHPTPPSSSVTGDMIIDRTITGADIASTTDLWVNNLHAANFTATGTAVVPNLSITGAMIANTTITNTQISAAAGIAYSKLSLSASILNADIANAAGIVYSKLTLSNSIVDNDVSTTSAIMYQKLKLTDSIVNADIASTSAIVDSKLAQITTASKVSGAALTLLANIPAGAGVIPAANVPSTSNQNTYSAQTAATSYLSEADTATTSVTGNFTLEFWYQQDKLSQAGTGWMVHKHNGTGNQRAYAVLMVNGGYEIVLSSDGAATTDRTYNIATSTTAWTHFALVYTAASGQIQIYVNGQLWQTDTGYPTSIFDSTASFIIGCNSAGATCFDGAIDDVRLWNTARTGAQIANNYNTQLVGNESGLKEYYKLNNSLVGSVGGETLTNNNSVTFNQNFPLMR